jgi:hypothetical protein
MGVWDAITSGELPSMNDIAESATGLYEGAADVGSDLYQGAAETVSDAGDAISSGAETVADGASQIGNEALGYGERALEGAGELISDGADAAWHGLTDWHFEDRDRLNGPAPDAGDLDADHGWTRQPDWMADLHQDESRDGREVKYVNADGRESIRYDDNGEDGGEVTDDRYRGTYNYVNPGVWGGDLENKGTVLGVPVGGAAEWLARGAGHALLDIAPWALGGTVRGPG